jgi:hypothetical protein
MIDLANELRWLLAEDQLIQEGKLDRKWVTGVKKWWKQWVKEAVTASSQFTGVRNNPTKRDLDKLLGFVTVGVDRIGSIRDDLYRNRGMLNMELTGNKKKDVRRGAKSLSELMTNLQAHVAHSTDEAISVLNDLRSKLEFAFSISTSEERAARFGDPWPPVRRYGVNGDLTAWESSVEAGLPEEAERADKIMDFMFKKIREFVTAYDKNYDDSFERLDKPVEFTVHGVKVRAVQGDFSLKNITKYKDRIRHPMDITMGVKEIAKAYSFLKRAGFQNVWHGTILLKPDSARYSFVGAKSGVGYKAVGSYHSLGDVVSVMYNPKNMVDILIHELGHRYYYRCMGNRERHGFDRWFEKVQPVTSYGSENTAEDFAEVFTAYVASVSGMHYGKSKLTRDQAERFLTFAKPGGRTFRCR